MLTTTTDFWILSHFLRVSLHVFSAHVFFGFQPLLVTMTQTFMHVPLHVLIIHHSPSRKDVHSISMEGQSTLPTPSLGWLIQTSPTPNSFSIKWDRDTNAVSLHVFLFSQFSILNMTKRRSNLLSCSNRSVKQRSTANQQPNAHNHVHSDDSSKQRLSVHRFSS